MSNYDTVLHLIFEVIEEVNLQNNDEEKIIKSEDTTLFGSGGSLDSLGLVNFIVAVESTVEEKLNTSITIADQRAMSQTNSPFNTVKSLATYITLLLEEENRE